MLPVLLLIGARTHADDRADCYLDLIQRAPETMTLGELRTQCAAVGGNGANPADPGSAAADADTVVIDTTISKDKTLPAEEGASFTKQIAAERQSLDRSYSLTPHLPNYLLAYSLRNDPNRSDLQGTNGGLQDQEAVLQVSVKFPLWRRMLGTENDLMFSYTSQSWFQAYNSALSKPFRETNYQPEIFWRHYSGPHLPLGIHIAGWDLGYDHQSNGRSEPLSRSWDRILTRIPVDLPHSVSLEVRAWYRIPESDNSDDNPDIERYLGYGDIRTIWTPNRNTFTALYRPAPEGPSFEATWSYPITKHLRLYTQYYNGYGESLIDYDQKVQRIGIGFTINDYLQVR
jgi:phospholipase A1